ncbi:hypothetical protein [Neptunicella marina]|uniref:Uncharacterized protein n=1 Tax=Neptunicella marina TaxID=2125989 RepID=A0A8J6IVP1_9ALTE|nr:hypothetical protein [Neptunicella marina]MBC3767219.1 hypothetical protein [Neptunicella marina]
MRLKDLLIFIVLLSIGCSARAQQAQSFDYPWPVEVFDLPVSDNKVQYRLYVRAPLRKVDKNAPVHCYYFLDALSNFTPAAAMSYNYEKFNYMPTGFFIGVGYTNEKDGNARTENRTRDYTPSQFTPDSKHFLFSALNHLLQ